MTIRDSTHLQKASSVPTSGLHSGENYNADLGASTRPPPSRAQLSLELSSLTVRPNLKKSKTWPVYVPTVQPLNPRSTAQYSTLGSLDEVPFIPSGPKTTIQGSHGEAEGALESSMCPSSSGSMVPTSVTEGSDVLWHITAPDSAILEGQVEASNSFSSSGGVQASKHAARETQIASSSLSPAIQQPIATRPESQRQSSVASHTSSRRLENQSPKFITSPLYGPHSPLHHPPRRTNTLPNGPEITHSSSSRGVVIPENAFPDGKRRRNSSKDRRAARREAGIVSNRAREMSATSMPLDTVAFSLGAFSSRKHSSFLTWNQHPRVIDNTGPLTTTSEPAYSRVPSSMSHFDHGYQPDYAVRQLTNEPVFPWPDSSSNPPPTPSNNGSSSSLGLSTGKPSSRPSTTRLSIPSSLAKDPSEPLSPVISASPTSPLAMTVASSSTPSASTTSTSSSSRGSLSSDRLRPRSVFGGVGIPRDVEKKSLVYAAKIGERRQQKLATLAAKYGMSESQSPVPPPPPPPPHVLPPTP